MHSLCPQRFRRPTGILVGPLLFVILTLWVPAARPQVDVWVPELPLTQDSGVSARAMGLGGAYLAISEDAAALRYNPAGLARVTRVEFSGSLNDLDREATITAQGNAQAGSLARTRVAALGFVYPFPTYRGSMVIALGYAAPWVLDRETRRAYPLEGNPAVEEIYDEGTVGEWSFGYAVDVSPTLSLGFRASWITGSWMRDTRWLRGTVLEDQLTTEFDVTGYTASVGALSRIGKRTRLGLTIDLPRWIQWDPLERSADGETVYEQEDLTFPFSAGIGTATTFRNLLIAADARYTDWTQIDYKGPMRYRDATGMHDAYRRVWELHFGAEYLVDIEGLQGLRLRAGYAYEPIPYRIILEDIVTGDPQDPWDDEPVYARANFSPQHSYFTFGAGLLIQDSITVDAAYIMGGFTRDAYRLEDDREERRILMTVALRLN